MACILGGESHRQQTDLLGNDPILASPEVFFRVISEVSQQNRRKSPTSRAQKPDAQRIHSLSASNRPWQPQTAGHKRSKTFDGVSKPLPLLPRDGHGKPQRTSKHLAMINEIADSIEPLTTSIRSNLYDAKRAALARLSLPLPLEADQSVANYCKGLHNDFSPVPALSPNDSFFLGKQIDTQCAELLEAIASHFLTLSLRGIFDFAKDDIIPTVQDDVLAFVLERVGVLLAEENPMTEMEIPLIRSISQTQGLLDNGWRRKSYCEWEKERKKKIRRREMGTVEYLDDTLDEVIGDIVSYFRIAMLKWYKYEKENITAINRSAVLVGKENKAVSNDSPLEEVQKAAIDAMWPALHGVKVGETLVVPLKELVLFPRKPKDDGPTLQTSPVKNPKVIHTADHLGESAIIHRFGDDTFGKFSDLYKHGQPDPQGSKHTLAQFHKLVGPEVEDSLSLRTAPEHKAKVMQAPQHAERKATVHHSQHISFMTPTEHHEHGRHRVPSPSIRPGQPQHHGQYFSFMTPKNHYQHKQPGLHRLGSPFVSKSRVRPYRPTSPKVQIRLGIPKRPLFGRPLVRVHDQNSPYHRSYSDTPLQHPQPMPSVFQRQPSNPFLSPIGSGSDSTVNALSLTDFTGGKRSDHAGLEGGSSRTQRSPIPACLRTGTGTASYSALQTVPSPRIGALLKRLPLLQTDWVFTNDESISEGYLFSGKTSSSTMLTALRHTEASMNIDGATEEEDEETEDIWLEAAQMIKRNSTAVSEVDSIDDLRARAQTFVKG